MPRWCDAAEGRLGGRAWPQEWCHGALTSAVSLLRRRSLCLMQRLCLLNKLPVAHDSGCKVMQQAYTASGPLNKRLGLSATSHLSLTARVQVWSSTDLLSTLSRCYIGSAAQVLKQMLKALGEICSRPRNSLHVTKQAVARLDSL